MLCALMYIVHVHVHVSVIVGGGIKGYFIVMCLLRHTKNGFWKLCNRQTTLEQNNYKWVIREFIQSSAFY